MSSSVGVRTVASGFWDVPVAIFVLSWDPCVSLSLLLVSDMLLSINNIVVQSEVRDVIVHWVSWLLWNAFAGGSVGRVADWVGVDLEERGIGV